MKKEVKMAHRKKKRQLIVFCSIALAVALLFNLIVFYFDIFYLHKGGVVTNISARAQGSDEIVLKLSYMLPSGGYSVKNIAVDEGIYVGGDGGIDYDSPIGKYKICIKFGDVELSSLCRLRLRSNQTINAGSVKLKASTATPSDHGIILYIGSDTPISVEEVVGGDLNPNGGTLKITLKTEQK